MTIIYFPGCTATYRMKEISHAAVKIFKKAGVEFKVLGEDEWCCGSVMLRTGNIPEAEVLIDHNLEALRAAGATKVVTTCSGCYKTISHDYKERRGDLGFEVVHLPQLVKELVDQGKLKFKQNNIKVTYHDPCHLGRHTGMYDIPRDVIKAIPGVELVEMGRSREFARCCGAGGGMLSGNKDISTNIGQDRIKDASATGAVILTTPCPFCTLHLSAQAQETGVDIKVMDFSEFVLENLE
jgi:heterodisulfide reductase subunit D